MKDEPMDAPERIWTIPTGQWTDISGIGTEYVRADLTVQAAARVLLANLPSEHQAWADLQDAVDAGKDGGDCIRAWLGALAAQK